MSIGVRGLIESLGSFQVRNSARQITQQVLNSGRSATQRASGGLFGSAAAGHARARVASLESYKLYGNGSGKVDILA
ncbi:MAG: hypothetical protein ACP5HU_10765 [Phycisphaerae bacterium]